MRHETDDRSRPEASPEDSLAAFEDRLGHSFRDRAWLERALTHRSLAGGVGEDAPASYERLEFLGDALVGLVVSAWLVGDDDDAPEGLLSRRKQTVVRAKTLAGAARVLGVGAMIRMSAGEETTGGRDRDGMLSDVFEALVGAVYLDAGYRAARRVVLRHLRNALRSTRSEDPMGEDYKTRLQERVQASRRTTPRYRIVGASGPDHDRNFVAEVWIGSRRWAAGSGSSRKRAEQAAAREALAALDRDERRR